MEVKVRIATGEEQLVSLALPLTWSGLGEAIEAATAIPVASQRIFLRGAVLKASSLALIGPYDTLVVLHKRRPVAEPPPDPTPIPTAETILNNTQTNTKQEAELAILLTNSLKRLVATLQGFVVDTSRNTSDGHPGRQDRGGGNGGLQGEEEVAVTVTVDGEQGAHDDGEEGEVLPLPPMDEEALAVLVSMGFPQPRCVRALYMSRMNLSRAMEYVLVHESDAHIDDPLSLAEVREIAGTRAFVPNEHAMAELLAMGFEAVDIVAALRATRNSLPRATSWLLGDGAQGRRPLPSVDASHPIIAAVLSDPTVEQGLLNTSVIQALHEIVTEPNAILRYMNDPVVGPILFRVHVLISSVTLTGGGPAAPSLSQLS